jgi:dTDP-glucose pyrophosphorylase
VVVENRGREELTSLIKIYIRQGSTIYSEKWKGYFSSNFNL